MWVRRNMITNTTQKDGSFGDFDFAHALEYLQLFPFLRWNVPPKTVHVSNILKTNLQRAERQLIVGSNAWELRLLMKLVFLEALENHDLRMWQEKQVDAGIAPFKGKADFVFTAYQASFRFPYVIMCEAKKDNFEQGWGQCLMATKAAHMMNEKQDRKFDLFSIVSSGKIWEFGKYTTDNKFYKTDSYSLAQVDIILGILHQIFTECEANK